MFIKLVHNPWFVQSVSKQQTLKICYIFIDNWNTYVLKMIKIIVKSTVKTLGAWFDFNPHDNYEK